MTFKVPEQFRVRTGRLGTSKADGNNGLFLIPGKGVNLRVIASDGEEWRAMHRFPGYEVSNIGKVMALEKRVPLPNGATRLHDAAFLKPERMSKGYLRVALVDCNHETRKVMIHELVAEAFIQNPMDFPEVNHRDGVKDNNVVTNLEWCSREYNSHHAIESGLRTGYSAEDICQIKAMLESMTPTQVAEALKTTRQTVSDIKNGRHRNLDPEQPSRYTGIPLWDHVSVSLPDRCPTWGEMCRVKSLFWDEEDTVMQLHPPKSEWVNLHNFCLHLWRPSDIEIPRPPSIMVGFRPEDL